MQIVYGEVWDETAQLHLTKVSKDSQIPEDSIKVGNYPYFSHADETEEYSALDN